MLKGFADMYGRRFVAHDCALSKEFNSFSGKSRAALDLESPCVRMRSATSTSNAESDAESEEQNLFLRLSLTATSRLERRSLLVERLLLEDVDRLLRPLRLLRPRRLSTSSDGRLSSRRGAGGGAAA